MSLFAGTSFLVGPGKKGETAEQAPSTSKAEEPEANSSTSASEVGAAAVGGTAAAPAKPAGPAWSAALRFAPAASRKAKAGPTQPSTARTTLPAGFTAAPPTLTPAAAPPTAVATSSRVHEVGFSAAPQLYNANAGPAGSSGAHVAPAEAPAVDIPTMDVQGKKIFRPPALTLGQGAGAGQGAGPKQGVKRPGQGQGEGGRKRKKKKNRPVPDAPVHHFLPSEAYNPAAPNDLAEWREYRAARKAERRAEEAARRARSAAGARSESEGSYYSEDEEDEDVPKRAAQKGFAPPPTLYAPPPSTLGGPAYAARPIYPEEEHQPPPPPQPHASVARTPMAQSGDDAWARRAAMSGGAASAVAAPSFVRPPAGPSFVAPSFVSSAPATASPSVDPPALASALSAPPGLADTPEEFQRKLEERKKAAAAVAARLANIMGSAAVPVPTGLGNSTVAATGQGAEPEQGGSFAEKMMRKMGYEEGKGLGREGTGIVHAFSAEHTAPGAAKPGKKSSGWVQAKTAQGRLVNLNENEKEKQDKEKYGEPSRIVCLGNVVGGPHEVDDDLSGEVAQECSGYGVVDRVIVHQVQPPPPEAADRVRIYIVFSGLAGAWKAVKELDGRFFGGRSLRATYFNEIRFNRGDRDGPVLTR